MVSTEAQKMYLLKEGVPIKTYTVSTGMGGDNSRQGSRGTPLGWHRIWLAVGEGEPAGRLISYKRVTDKMIPITADETRADGDYLITRVLALDGLEPGFNKGGNADAVARGINIHGTPEEGLLGRRVSHGCVRMSNADVIELYGQVSVNTLVYITNSPPKP